MLHELIYSSRAASNITNEALENILEVSRINNSTKNISGLLIFDGITFCQILEGNKAVLDDTFDKIKQDNRHIDTCLFHSGEIEERSFSDWSMSFKRSKKQIQLDNWTDWLTAQKLISSIPSENTLGCMIFKLVNGAAPFEQENKLGLS